MVALTNMEMPKSCQDCEWSHFQNATGDGEYLMDARCERLINSQDDWYGEDKRGGWIGVDLVKIEGYENYTGYYYYEHALKEGTRAAQCPLREI